ncbi:holo-ACP synthase [Thalassoroseus pseudoceratinae]|uniref:holo-ACP synthase n=1 Tax=Thalassoroseus pseudoceratinae TaxID=2713176 RepID=UPI00142232FB|nr:holo-ACP synthase [Thalassoroseus pseudoceratinae]
MTIIGLGTDIVEIARIGRMIERHGELFLRKIYTDEEIKYCHRRRDSYPNFAGRWAAKEAVMKTLGTGVSQGVSWQHVEVVSLPSGAPTMKVRGGAWDYARSLGIDDFLITISHCRAYATATAIAIRND